MHTDSSRWPKARPHMWRVCHVFCSCWSAGNDWSVKLWSDAFALKLTLQVQVLHCTSHVTRHTSHVTHPPSPITRHTPRTQEHKLSVRHLLLQHAHCPLPQLWSSSDDKTVKVWSATDAACSGGAAPASLFTITLPCVALVCEAVEVFSAASGAASEDDCTSVWLGCDDNVIRVWSCKRRQLAAELKHHKVCGACAHQLHRSHPP